MPTLVPLEMMIWKGLQTIKFCVWYFMCKKWHIKDVHSSLGVTNYFNSFPIMIFERVFTISDESLYWITTLICVEIFYFMNHQITNMLQAVVQWDFISS